jgi:hypothetical protein
MAKRPSLLKSGKKRKAPRLARSLDEKYMGVEPTWEDQDELSKDQLRSRIGAAYNWYNYFNKAKDKAKLLVNNYPRDKKELRIIKRLPDWKINSTAAYLSRMQVCGLKIPEEALEYLNNSLDEMLELAKELKEEKKEETKEKKPVLSIQERIREQISEYIGEIEGEVDKFTLERYKTDFKTYDWLQKNGVKSQQSNAVASYYKPLLTELLELQGGMNPQLNEGYSHMKKAEVKRFVEFVASIIGDAETWGSNQKTVRKTRKKKPISTEKQIKNLKFEQENKEYKIVSINPADIIGADQLWVFNTKYRMLKKFQAIGPSGLLVKGTTLQGYDPDESIQKKLRKPDEILPQVLSGGKRVMKKLMSEINSKESQIPNGRINGDTILLRVLAR